MGHRCTHGEEILRVYVGMVNADSTEGKGPMREHSFWTTPDSALKAIKGQGVMGVGDGDITMHTYFKCDAAEPGETCDHILIAKVQVYDGYAARGGNMKGFCPDGWRPDLSPLNNDPEYKDYLRLKKKFGDK
jgi:hypothetical protein